MDDDLVANFVAITGASEPVARQLLEIAGGNIEQAAVLFYDTDMAEALARQAPAAAAETTTTRTARSGTPASGSRAASSTRRGGPSNAQSRQSSRRPQPHHEDADGVITIDDSDDNDENMDDFDEPEDLEDIDDDDDDYNDNDIIDVDADDAAAIAQKAQEEEDAAMAKRLQEEMYSEAPGGSGGAGRTGGGGLGDDDIRAPMGRTTEVLVEPSYTGGSGGFGSYGDASFEQMRAEMNMLRQGVRRTGPRNPFNQVWDDPDAAGSSSGQSNGVTDGDAAGGPSFGPSRTAPTSRQARLADLFRPPYDLIERVSSWDEARSIGKEEKRWILANIQDLSDFQCQALNRDIWKDEAIRQLVRENFLFLQYSKDDINAQSYINYYMPGGQDENPDNYPHIGVVDPRTGEQVKVWSGRPFPTALEFHAQLAEFLDRYSLDATKKNPVQRTKPQAVVKDVGRMTEDEMLEMALRNSLATAGGSGSGTGEGGASTSGSNGTVQDPDGLTGTPAPEAKEEAEEGLEEAEEEDASSSAFAAIASDRPHEEPPAQPAAASTRIQFRHPTGRVIRRFAVDDHVVRIYEWLKAAPLEGREGVAFELKMMPQGQDLLEVLDKTIEEAGLKQATVMIEFLD
ncbi:UBX domain protein Ubx2 [Sporothrix bragantina]|uniref:UBX domain protein Ubx2 n=1 Tax=Sporothrix bragantina TaxID=671064 RepID=A0ABP0C6G6_9PEZI